MTKKINQSQSNTMLETRKFPSQEPIWRLRKFSIPNPEKVGFLCWINDTFLTVKNLDYYERLLNYVYDERLGVKSNEHPLLMSEVPNCTPSNREKLTSLVFEKLNAPDFFLSKQPVLSCFANGKYTALVVDSGHNSTVVTAVHDGFALQKSVVRTNRVSGKVFDQELRQLLKQKRGGKDVLALHQFTKQRNSQHASSKSAKILETSIPGLTKSFNDYFIEKAVSDAKIHLLRVSEEKIVVSNSTPVVTYEMNDGTDVDVGSERFTICEHLFSDEYGLPKLSYESINKCDVDLRKELYQNILLTGGNTLFPNTPTRYETELSKLAPSNVKVKPCLNTKQSANIHSLISAGGSSQSTTNTLQTAVGQLQERKYASFMGGSILASLGGFQQMWISKSEYEEAGAAGILARKCP